MNTYTKMPAKILQRKCDNNYDNVKHTSIKGNCGNDWKNTPRLFWKNSSGVINTVCHILIGVVTSVSSWYALKTVHIKSLTSTQTHILLCVIGYQILMAEAILTFNTGNSWAQGMTVHKKKLAHWLLQVAGCSLAIAGSVIKMLDKPVNFTSTHGIIGFVAMLLTCTSLLNGLSALYAYELRSLAKPKFLKLAHIISGTFAFVLASICLCYGFDKAKFRSWATPGATTIVIALCGLNTFLVILNPLINGFKKLYF